MVSSGPYTQSMNQTHMFDLPDLRGPLPIIIKCPNSLSGIVDSHPDFTKFKYMLNLAKLDTLYGDLQADFTIFVPSDNALRHINNNVFLNMNKNTARHIIKSSTLKRKITSAILSDSPASWFHTMDPPNRLFVTNINGKTYLNNTINVVHKDIPASNGIIHVIDGLIWPEMVSTAQY